jgi:hypothetical protein
VARTFWAARLNVLSLSRGKIKYPPKYLEVLKMPKGNPGGDDRAKVKLRVIEFELEGANASVENSIRQLTNALATRNGNTKPIAPAKPAKELSGGTPEDEVLDAEPVEEESEGEPEAPAQSPKAPARTKSKPKPPEYLPNMLNKEQLEAFKEFAKTKTGASSRNQQYLVSAFWVKEHGGHPTVTQDKIFTLFKTAGWSVGFSNWRAPFDNLVHTSHMRKVGVGEFAILPPGEDEVSKMQ